jgi:hypothetical protein
MVPYSFIQSIQTSLADNHSLLNFQEHTLYNKVRYTFMIESLAYPTNFYYIKIIMIG